jgi:hypothetical protein
VLIEHVGSGGDQAGLLRRQRVGEDRRGSVSELVMLRDGLHGLLSDPQVLAPRERAEDHLPFAGQRTAQERREPRVLRDLRGLDVTLPQHLGVVHATREPERRRTAQLGKTTRERRLGLRRRRHVGERPQRRLRLLRGLGAERPDQRVEYMELRSEQALDGERVLVGDEARERIRGRGLARLGERPERTCGLRALRRGEVRVGHRREDLRRDLLREVLAGAAQRLDGKDARVARTRQRSSRDLHHALAERLAGICARERIEREVGGRRRGAADRTR